MLVFRFMEFRLVLYLYCIGSYIGLISGGPSRDQPSQFPELRIALSNRRQLKHLPNPIIFMCLWRISRQRNQQRGASSHLRVASQTCSRGVP